MENISFHVADAEKEAAYYNALMGWKVRSQDANTIVMDIGTWGGAVFKGGLVVPTPPAAPADEAAAGAPTAAGGRAGQPGAGGGGGGRRGGGANGANRAAAAAGNGGRGGVRQPPRCVVDGFSWGIEPWDTEKVETALKKRNLNPVADHAPGANFYSFHVKDPDGLAVQITNGNRRNRRIPPSDLDFGHLPFAPTGWQTVFLDHISFGASNYKETVAFYEALLGWKGLGDEGSQNETIISPDIGGLLIRGANALDPAYKAPNPRMARIDHIAFGIANFDPDVVKEEMTKRGLNASTDTGATQVSADFERDIHTASYKSYHTTTPNGYNLQISDHIRGPQPITQKKQG
jgi:catechol 2,3-dioxygenase-like lactoylglutathione lyase family enzyme